jgi:hypothetical protein
MKNMGYMEGLRGARPESERPGSQGGVKGRRGNPQRRRMAGDALDLDLKRSLGMPQAFSAPLPIGEAELRTPYLPQ